MNFGLYVLRRLFAIIPTLIGISFISFVLINAAPGGPIEQALQKMKYSSAMGSGGGTGSGKSMDSAVTEEVMESLRKQYGYDKPMLQRYWIWISKLVRFDFGDSFSQHAPVLGVIKAKLPVSLTFGLVSLLLTYLICIPLGIFKAMWNGSKFDLATSFAVTFSYALPPFMLAVLLLVWLGPGGWDLFPLQGIRSEFFDLMTPGQKVWNRIHHAFLPLLCYCVGNFASITLLMKTSMLEEIKKDYVRTARAKGLNERLVIFKHVLRNALVPIATGLGGIFTVFFAGSLLLETIFNLDGMGLLSFNSTLQRDYNVIMGLLTIQSILILAGNLFSDLIYVLIDPRIDFSADAR